MNTMCPYCDAVGTLSSKEELQTFRYGDEPFVELSAMVLVFSCLKCKIEYTGEEGEISRHEAVCRHLGMMTPREILEMRERLNLSQLELSKMTGLDELYIAKLECGSLIQGSFTDRLLRGVKW